MNSITFTENDAPEHHWISQHGYNEFVKKFTTTTINIPYLWAPMDDTWMQVIILGHNHLSAIGLNISCLHRMTAVLDCANASAPGAMGVFYRCVSN